MAVGLLVDCFYYELGHSDFVHSFFSTISYHLEKEGWGTKYPLLMDELYNGKLSWIDVSDVKADLIEIEQKLLKYSPEYVVWDIDDLSKAPPWGDKMNPQIKSLANYFAAANGRTFFEVIRVAMDVAKEDKCDIKLRHI
ncbi:immunity 70 family protein [Metabacillus fastidiosus]|uniref:immunity 70 family protein n=1 Tax=Metabacillus fastidiosus TaxID=1458 RepID=UPI002DB65A32|nr:immunity 70 family protein [Metabacillus fastidiosus]MEC2077029.1 immunity 70 family protein [Metabacillus fastidiosus]